MTMPDSDSPLSDLPGAASPADAEAGAKPRRKRVAKVADAAPAAAEAPAPVAEGEAPAKPKRTCRKPADADAAGSPAEGVPDAPAVTVAEGGGSLVDTISADETYPGYWRVRVRVGPDPGQANRFRIEAGPVVREVSIRTR